MINYLINNIFYAGIDSLLNGENQIGIEFEEIIEQKNTNLIYCIRKIFYSTPHSEIVTNKSFSVSLKFLKISKEIISYFILQHIYFVVYNLIYTFFIYNIKFIKNYVKEIQEPEALSPMQPLKSPKTYQILIKLTIQLPIVLTIMIIFNTLKLLIFSISYITTYFYSYKYLISPSSYTKPIEPPTSTKTQKP